MRHDEQHARASLGGIGVDFSDIALDDGGFENESAGGLPAFLHFVRVSSLAHDLKPTVNAVNRSSHQPFAILIQRVARSRCVYVLDGGRVQASVRTARSVRRSSGIFKSLWP